MIIEALHICKDIKGKFYLLASGYEIDICFHYRQNLYGKNLITIEVQSYVRLLFTEVLNPFYMFQIASIILWSLDEYYQYALCIFIISCISIGVSLWETRKVMPYYLIIH